jgi:hypothetical protein
LDFDCCAPSFFELGTEFGKHTACEAVGFPDKAEKKVLSPDVVITEIASFIVGEVDDPLGPWGQRHVLRWAGVAPWKLLFDFVLDTRECDAHERENPCRSRVLVSGQTEEKVFG